MANTEYKRDYNYSDSELTFFTQRICELMRVDLVFFEEFEVKEADIDHLQGLCNIFKVFPTDDYVSEEYFSATINKNNLMQELKIIVRNMSLRVKLRFGKNSPKYQNLGISFLGKISDEEFISKVRMIYSFLDEHKSELAEVGMTQLMLDNMADKIKELFDAKIFQIDKSIIRVEKTIERIVKGNEIFKLVSGYCEIGKKVWDGINPAKYNNYLIYKGSSKPKKKKEEEIIKDN